MHTAQEALDAVGAHGRLDIDGRRHPVLLLGRAGILRFSF
jgi:hypothetical protein